MTLIERLRAEDGPYDINPEDDVYGLNRKVLLIREAAAALEEAQRANETAEMNGRIKTINLASYRIEQRVEQLDQWAKESADKGEYSGAASNQKAAVDLHCAVEILKGPHDCRHSGFRYDLGDRCDRCAFDAAKKGQQDCNGARQNVDDP